MSFSYRVERWTDDGNGILDYVAAVGVISPKRKPRLSGARVAFCAILRQLGDRGAEVSNPVRFNLSRLRPGKGSLVPTSGKSHAKGPARAARGQGEGSH